VVQRPSDLQSADANLGGGAINGGTAQLQQQAIFRPSPGFGRAETPIRNVFLGSASAHPVAVCTGYADTMPPVRHWNPTASGVAHVVTSTKRWSHCSSDNPAGIAKPLGIARSISSSQIRADISDGARQSPQGDNDPPWETLGPLGNADRLNWLNE
jgi:hypothetical protein